MAAGLCTPAVLSASPAVAILAERYDVSLIFVVGSSNMGSINITLKPYSLWFITFYFRNTQTKCFVSDECVDTLHCNSFHVKGGNRTYHFK